MKGMIVMILFTILLIITLILLAFVILTIAAGGIAFLIVFADVIVCAWIILMIMKQIMKRKH